MSETLSGISQRFILRDTAVPGYGRVTSTVHYEGNPWNPRTKAHVTVNTYDRNKIQMPNTPDEKTRSAYLAPLERIWQEHVAKKKLVHNRVKDTRIPSVDSLRYDKVIRREVKLPDYGMVTSIVRYQGRRLTAKVDGNAFASDVNGQRMFSHDEFYGNVFTAPLKRLVEQHRVKKELRKRTSPTTR